MIKVRARAANKAEILIYDPIGEDWFGNGVTAKRFREELEALGEVNDITVRINSPGGAVWDGFAIYNALKEHPAQVLVHVDGLAASIASVIAMSGDLVIMGEGAMLMIHDPWSIAIGDSEDMRSVAEMLDKVKVGLVKAYASRTGISEDEIAAMMEEETWFTADEAIEQGFADERVKESQPEPEPAAAGIRWAAVMAKYRNVPKDFKTPREAADPPKSAPAGAPSSSKEGDMDSNAPASVQDTDKLTPEQRQSVLAEESKRRKDIRTAFGRFSDEHKDLLDTCLDDATCTVAKAGEKLLAALAEGREPINPESIQPGPDGRDRFAAGATKALLSRLGIEKREAANEFNGLSLTGIAAQALKLAGIPLKGHSNDQIARQVLATHTSSDFPQLMSNVAGKVLRAAYDSFPDTWRAWCGVGEVSDFKIHPRIQIGSFESMETIPEGGEFKYGAMLEDYENAQAATKGKAIALTRQMIVNDDLGAFNRLARMMGRAAARTVNADVYALLTSGSGNHGPTSADTGQYFNDTAVTTAGGHANLLDSGGAITVASLGVGRAAMRVQKDKGLNESLNIQPKYLVVPVALEDTAKTIVTAETKDGQSNSKVPNVLRNAFEVVSDPSLDGVSATRWYLFADPMDVAAFEVVFLDGNQTPFLDDMIDFDTDAMKFKVRLDYGVAIGDWRGAYANDGA